MESKDYATVNYLIFIYSYFILFYVSFALYVILCFEFLQFNQQKNQLDCCIQHTEMSTFTHEKQLIKLLKWLD